MAGVALEGRDVVGEVPPERWDVDAYYDPDPSVPGKSRTKAGGFLQDIEGFEPSFFGMSPREATGLDPQQRLLLEVAWQALEDAGIAPESLVLRMRRLGLPGADGAAPPPKLLN